MTRVFTLLALCAAASFGAAADLSTLSGKKYQGELVGIADGVLTFRTAVGAVGVGVKDLYVLDTGAKVVAPAKGAKFDALELVDGSVVACGSVRVKGKIVEPVLLAGPVDVAPPVIVLPLGAVFAYARGVDDPKAAGEWKALLATRGKRDLFVVRSADGLNPVPGTVLEGTEAGDAVVFEKEDGSKTTYKLIRATGGIVFNQPPRGEVPPTLCKVFDVFGNVLLAKSVVVAGAGLKIATVAGAEFVYPNVKAVARLDFSQGNITYLSDMDPQVTAPAAVAGEPHFTYLRDKTDENGPIKLDGQTFGKGLWVAPDTVLNYKIGGDYREFKAVVGVDESVQVASSSARVTITADGRTIFNEVVTRKDKPKPITLDVKGVKVLTIAVDRDGLFLGNQATLADARVQK